MTTFTSILLTVLLFGFLIFIHEFGHYFTARLFRVSIMEFSVGMGPRIYSRVSKKTGIRYSLAALPIGGFVSMEGEDGEGEDALPEGYVRREGTEPLCRKTWWRRVIVLASGAAMNLVVGVLVMFLLVGATKGLIGTTVVARFLPAEETGFDVSSADSGLLVGDEILSVNHRRVYTASELMYEISHDGIRPVDVTVRRGGEKVTLTVTFPTTVEQNTLFGSVDFQVYGKSKSVSGVFREAFFRSAMTVRMIWESIFDLIRGRYGIDAVSGPVGMTGAVGEAASLGAGSFFYLAVVISMNLGIVNLLPIPALDGGHIVFTLIEAVRKKPIDPKKQGAINFAFLALLMLFMLLVTVKDVIQLFP